MKSRRLVTIMKSLIANSEQFLVYYQFFISGRETVY